MTILWATVLVGVLVRRACLNTAAMGITRTNQEEGLLGTTVGGDFSLSSSSWWSLLCHDNHVDDDKKSPKDTAWDEASSYLGSWWRCATSPATETTTTTRHLERRRLQQEEQEEDEDEDEDEEQEEISPVAKQQEHQQSSLPLENADLIPPNQQAQPQQQEEQQSSSSSSSSWEQLELYPPQQSSFDDRNPDAQPANHAPLQTDNPLAVQQLQLQQSALPRSNQPEISSSAEPLSTFLDTITGHQYQDLDNKEKRSEDYLRRNAGRLSSRISGLTTLTTRDNKNERRSTKTTRSSSATTTSNNNRRLQVGGGVAGEEDRRRRALIVRRAASRRAQQGLPVESEVWNEWSETSGTRKRVEWKEKQQQVEELRRNILTQAAQQQQQQQPNANRPRTRLRHRRRRNRHSSHYGDEPTSWEERLSSWDQADVAKVTRVLEEMGQIPRTPHFDDHLRQWFFWDEGDFFWMNFDLVVLLLASCHMFRKSFWKRWEAFQSAQWMATQQQQQRNAVNANRPLSQQQQQRGQRRRPRSTKSNYR